MLRVRSIVHRTSFHVPGLPRRPHVSGRQSIKGWGPRTSRLCEISIRVSALVNPSLKRACAVKKYDMVTGRCSPQVAPCLMRPWPTAGSARPSLQSYHADTHSVLPRFRPSHKGDFGCTPPCSDSSLSHFFRDNIELVMPRVGIALRDLCCQVTNGFEG